jgi:hypothetical protein
MNQVRLMFCDPTRYDLFDAGVIVEPGESGLALDDVHKEPCDRDAVLPFRHRVRDLVEAFGGHDSDVVAVPGEPACLAFSAPFCAG